MKISILIITVVPLLWDCLWPQPRTPLAMVAQNVKSGIRFRP